MHGDVATFSGFHGRCWRGRWVLVFTLLAAIPSAVRAADKVLPVLNHTIADGRLFSGQMLPLDLSMAFGTEAIDDQVVRFSSSNFMLGDVPVAMDFALFKNRTPVTRTNFLKYVSDGDYINSFIHRSVPGFVVQGGGFRITASSIESVPTDPPIVNEFGISNTLGTVAMAKLGGDPDSATSQWFVNTVQNSDQLDDNNGGFTVFARVTKSTLGNALAFGNPSLFPVFDYSSYFGGVFNELPLWYQHVVGNPQISQFILFDSVSLVPIPNGEAGESSVLSYSVVSNSNPAVLTPLLQGGILQLQAVSGQTGSTALTVRATDSVGNTVDDTFVVTVAAPDTYSTWAARQNFAGGNATMSGNPDGDSWNSLLEFALMGNPIAAESGAAVTGGTQLISNQRLLTLTFPVRKFTSGLEYIVEASEGLASNTWNPIWRSSDGFSHAQVTSAIDQTDRTMVTVKDNIAGSPMRFMRLRVTHP